MSNKYMRLQSHISRKYKNNSYRKFWVIIPNKLLEKLGWKIGEELESEVKGNKLIVDKKSK